ncbi:MAG: His/Gly/Thr/Pro-type tRNA ligase C-terminal domain-containing protein [Candidatus Nanopusillus sp.]|nr:His/Gly/Thr/Pro-type tRNA ligase C-terminal domain-containing protein [Candidatus Nanopusillus sp.]
MDLNDKIKFFINRGFFYESQSIYGSRSGFYDYGSLGTLLKRRFENLWRIYFGKLFDNIYEIQPSEIMHKNTFIASRHLELFNDPIVECKNGHRFRADKLIEEKLNIRAESLTIEEMNKIFDEEKVVCPECGSKLSHVKLFNLMFPIYVGPVYDLFLILEEIKRKYGFLVDLLIKKYRKINEKELNYIIKNYLKNKKLYSINLNNEKYIFDENKEIIIKIKDDEYYIYPENIEIKEEDINYLEILNNAEEIKIDFNINELYNLIKSYIELKNNEMFLRPETAQGPYVNFPNEIIINRYRLPLGLYVIGKAFRNEISPRNVLLRMREFTQAELQIFFDYYNNPFENEFEFYKDKYINVLLVKDRDKKLPYIEKSLEEIYNETKIDKFYLYFLYKVFEFYINILKIPKERIRFYQLSDNEKSFYNMYHFDIEIYLDEIGWTEVGGIHFRVLKFNREIINKVDEEIRKDVENLFIGDEIYVGYDLWNHFILSKDRRFILTRPNGSKFIPVELELSFGVDRNIFSLLLINYDGRILRLPDYLSPIQIAVFPLLENNENMVKVAKEIYNKLRKKFDVYYDDSGRIGIRYKRQDEIGTYYCITVDDQTLKDNTVTVRFRDTKEQIRININDLEKFFEEKFDIWKIL